MNKTLKTLYAISLTTVILAACGTSADPKGTSPQKDTAATNPQNQQPPQQVSTPPATDQKTSDGTSPAVGKDSNTAQSASTQVNLPKEKNLALDGNAKKQVKANLFESSKQPLYLYLVDKFKATDEPTKKDTLVQNANHSIKMQITVLPKDQDLDSLKKEAMREMKKTTRSVKEVTSLQNDKFYQNAIILQGSTSKESKSVYILSVDGTPVEVSITRPKKSSAVPELVTMMKSIGIKDIAMQ
jgi:hypothetical protein